MAVGQVVFDASEGYSEDLWDDSALIRNYDRAYQASRELMRRRKEVTSGGGKKKQRQWSMGEACRAVYCEDGLEYEGVVASINNSTRRAVVRLHGYNQEIEVRLAELEPSQGQEAVSHQIEEAELELGEEEIEEEPLKTSQIKVGAYCRARWSLDDQVYEGVIQSLDGKRQRARVKFVGYGNEDTVEQGDLMASKGEEWREEQEKDAELMSRLEESNLESQHHSPNVLNGRAADDLVSGMNSLGLEAEAARPRGKDKGSKADKNKRVETKSPASEKKSRKKMAAEAEENAAAGGRSTLDFSPRQTFSSNAPLPSHLPPVTPSAAWLSSGGDIGAAAAAGFSTVSPPMPPFSLPSATPSYLAPPPPLTSDDVDFFNSNPEALHAMLMSWYMAGYHSGFYQGLKTGARRRDGETVGRNPVRSKR